MNSFLHNAIFEMCTATTVLQESEQRQVQILDADYSAIDVNKYISELTYLTVEQKSQLAQWLLQQYPTVFQGGFGIIKIPPVHLELCPDAKPYHAKAFLIPQSLEARTKQR
jgi:hypothetical protein